MDIAAIVEQVTQLTVDNTIDIPRIIVSPSGEVRTGYHPFDLDIAAIKGLKPIDRTLIQQSLTRQSPNHFVAKAIPGQLRAGETKLYFEEAVRLRRYSFTTSKLNFCLT